MDMGGEPRSSPSKKEMGKNEREIKMFHLNHIMSFHTFEESTIFLMSLSLGALYYFLLSYSLKVGLPNFLETN